MSKTSTGSKSQAAAEELLTTQSKRRKNSTQKCRMYKPLRPPYQRTDREVEAAADNAVEDYEGLLADAEIVGVAPEIGGHALSIRCTPKYRPSVDPIYAAKRDIAARSSKSIDRYFAKTGANRGNGSGKPLSEEDMEKYTGALISKPTSRGPAKVGARYLELMTDRTIADRAGEILEVDEEITSLDDILAVLRAVLGNVDDIAGSPKLVMQLSETISRVSKRIEDAKYDKQHMVHISVIGNIVASFASLAMKYVPDPMMRKQLAAELRRSIAQSMKATTPRAAIASAVATSMSENMVTYLPQGMGDAPIEADSSEEVIEATG